MSTNQQDVLLGLIPTDQLKPHQKARYRKGTPWNTYRLLREPRDVNEFESYRPGVAIWRDNGTLVYVLSTGDGPLLNDKTKHLSVGLCARITCTIVGQSDQAIVETVEYLCSLPHAGETRRQLAMCTSNRQFQCNLIRPQLLAKILEMDPHSPLQLSGLTLSTTQSVVLATMRGPVKLILLNSIRFEDGGTAFIDALESRQSHFGSLQLSAYNDYNRDGLCLEGALLQRLLQTNCVDKLEVIDSLNDELIPFLFFSAIDTISWKKCKQNGERQEIDISPGSVTLKLWFRGDFPVDSIFSSLFHLEHLDLTHLTVYINKVSSVIPEQIFRDLFALVAANPNLQLLDWEIDLKSVEVLKELLSVVEHHTTLCTFKLAYYPCMLDSDESMLIQMLSRNRNIEMRDNPQIGWLGRFMNNTSRSKIIPLNRFYRGSKSMGQVAPSIRPTLVGTSLMRSASNNFQRCALLLADHTDVLCQFLQGGEAFGIVDQVVQVDSEDGTPPVQEKDCKRKMTDQLQQASKKEQRRT